MSSDLDILISQTGLLPEEAGELLAKHNGDVVNAITHFFSPSYNESDTLNKSFTNVVPPEIGELRKIMKDSTVCLENYKQQLQLVPTTSEVEVTEELENPTVD